MPQDYRTDPETGFWAFYRIHFHPRETWRELLKWPSFGNGFHLKSMTETPVPVKRRIRALFQEIIRQAKRTSPLGDAPAMNLLENLFLHCCQEQSVKPLDSEFVESLKGFIQENLRADLSIESLAAHVALSPSRFAHRFSASFGISPRNYVENCRLELGKRLLASGACSSVREVAYAVGFNGPLNFSKRFRIRYGYAPNTLLR